MSTAALQRLGSNATVARALTSGDTEGEVLDLLAEKWPGFSAADYQGAYDQGLQGWQAAQVWGLDPSGVFLTPSMVPGSGGLRGAYRWFVMAEYWSPTAGKLRGIPVDFTTSGIPDQIQVEAALRQALNDVVAEEPPPGTDRPRESNPVLTRWKLLTVQR